MHRPLHQFSSERCLKNSISCMITVTHWHQSMLGQWEICAKRCPVATKQQAKHVYTHNPGRLLCARDGCRVHREQDTKAAAEAGEAAQGPHPSGEAAATQRPPPLLPSQDPHAQDEGYNSDECRAQGLHVWECHQHCAPADLLDRLPCLPSGIGLLVIVAIIGVCPHTALLPQNILCIPLIWKIRLYSSLAVSVIGSTSAAGALLIMSGMEC